MEREKSAIKDNQNEVKAVVITPPEFVDRPHPNEKFYQAILLVGIVAGVIVALWHLIVWSGE